MQLQIEIGDRIRNVVVQRKGDLFTVTIDGHAHAVDARRLDPETLSLLVEPLRSDVAPDGAKGNAAPLSPERNPAPDGAERNPAPDGAERNTVRSVEAAIAPGREAGALTVSVNGQAVPVQLRVGGAGRRGRDAGSAAGAGPQKVTAPMPGKVVRVLVKPGDEVNAKQGLVVVEAMKMENELKAARAGRVRDVLVTEGRSVDAGTVLVIVD